LARLPEDSATPYLLPPTPDIDRTVVPEGVSLMIEHVVAVAASSSPEEMVVDLAAGLFTMGLREQAVDATEMLNTGPTVRALLDDSNLAGIHRPVRWTELEDLVARAGESGVVMALGDSGGIGAVYTLMDDVIWRIDLGDPAGRAVPWDRPHDLADVPGYQSPPLRVLAINKCADLLTA
jgi:hypothetical protein